MLISYEDSIHLWNNKSWCFNTDEAILLQTFELSAYTPRGLDQFLREKLKSSRRHRSTDSEGCLRTQLLKVCLNENRVPIPICEATQIFPFYIHILSVLLRSRG